MNKKVTGKKEKRSEERESSRFNLQQNLGQKENLPLSTVDPEDYGMVMWTFWNLSGGTMSLPTTLNQLDGYVIASLGCPVQTPCITIELSFPI